MKNLVLKNPSYEHLERGFKEWLDILGYSQGMCSYMPAHVREFLNFLEQRGCNQINQLDTKHYKAYLKHISTRANQRRGGGLSNQTINHQIQSLEKLYEYLIHKGAQGIPPVTLKQLKLNRENLTVLSQDEIKELFEATNHESENVLLERLTARDKAMLVVYYACGLRRKEGANLNVDDLNFDRRILHVRKGKNYKERFVPFSKSSSKILQEYVYDHRPSLIKSQKEDRLFIGYRGKPLSGGSLYGRLQKLILAAGNPELIQKPIGLHTLRHSIATHLLQNGMDLQKIQRFLGHSSLESTQIYTHLIEKENVEHQ